MLQTNRGINNPQIVYEDKVNNRKLVYRIVCKEDVEKQQQQQQLQQQQQQQRQSQSKELVNELTSESSDDEDDYGEIRSNNDIILDPHDVIKMTDPATILGKKRKRGRPTEFEKFFMPKPKKKHSKQLKQQFGLTIAQAAALESDIVDDKQIVEVEVKDEDDVLSTSRTRSGRLSRPPRTIVPNPNTSVGSILDFPNLPPPPPPPDPLDLKQIEPKARRKFTVPLKFRCRVCQKIYLGDRKMARHMKAYPTHGPIEDPNDPTIPQSGSEAVTTSPVVTTTQGKKISPSSLAMPIIPLARTQLEELVKNLDAELVLDCVSKKMFDNFSMWDLQLKKMQLNKEKGLKRLEVMLKDMENVMVELKKMVDNCLTHTKLCDKPSPSVTVGEHLQLALNSHDGEMYLEQPNHIPEEYHKYFGIQPIISSPRSESNTMVTNPDDDSNSMMSDKDGQGLGAQMVLEENLGCREREDEDEDSNSKPPEKRPESSSLMDSNSKMDDSLLHDEDSNMSDGPTKANKNIKVENTPVISQVPTATTPNTVNQQHQRTRLPSFSSIIAGSPKQEDLQDICLVDQPEPAPDHHSVPSSRRGSIECETRPNLDLRRCSLDQTQLLATMNTSQQDALVRRNSIDSGLMIRSTLEPNFVDTFSTPANDITEGHDLLTSLESKAANEFPNLDHPGCSFANAVVTSSTPSITSSEANINPAFTQSGEISEMFESVVTSSQTSISVAPMQPVASSSTHVSFSQQVLVSGVQSLPGSGPPSVHNEPRHASMPNSPLAAAPPSTDDLVVSSKDHEFHPTQTSSSNFLMSELESVLGTAGTDIFTASPEKLLASIPPSSMMLEKPVSENQLLEQSSASSRGTSQRTDFLGALGNKSSRPSRASSPTNQDNEKLLDVTKDKNVHEPKTVDLNAFDDGPSGDLICSTLADFQSTTSIVSKPSLDTLFDDIPTSSQESQN